MKLWNWQRLPWLLAGLAHLNEDTARRCANESIAQYDSAPDEAALHHRLTLEFCGKIGPLRADLEAFAAGASRDELPAFRTEATKLFFIPVTERSIEEPHSRVMRAITYRHHSPLSVTMSLRMRVIEWTIARSAERMCILRLLEASSVHTPHSVHARAWFASMVARIVDIWEAESNKHMVYIIDFHHLQVRRCDAIP